MPGPGGPYKNAVCRGCWALGTACGRCERCAETRPDEKPKPALDCALDELDRVIELWRESEITSRDFQTMLYRLLRRLKNGLPPDQIIAQAEDLLKRKNTMSILRTAE